MCRLNILLCVIIPLTFLSSWTSAYLQEIYLYDTADRSGPALRFTSNIPDLGAYPNAKTICYTGWWLLYCNPNYKSYRAALHTDGPVQKCEPKLSNMRSLRHIGASDTINDALSLYETSFLEGPETYFDGPKLSGISVPIKYVHSTGLSNWTLFEGKNFDGLKTCYKGSWSPVALYNGQAVNWPMKTVGSVRKGCDPQ